MTLNNIIQEDSIVEGNETFRLLLHKGASNPESLMYVNGRGFIGQTCTPGETCSTRIIIVDNDGITTPTEHPDWTLTGASRVFAGTSSANGNPTVSGTESAVRCLDSTTAFELLDANDNPVTGTITYSLHVADGYAGHPGITSRFDVPGMFGIDDIGQLRTKVGVDYPHGTGPDGSLRTIYANVRATVNNRYAEYRQGFVILHPYRTDWDDQNPQCTEPRSSQAPLTGQVQNAPDSHDGSTAFTFRILFSEEVDIEPDALRDDAIKVSHATVTAVARVNGRDDLWEVTLTPNATQAISFQIRGQLECTQDAAVCTADGKKLAANVTHSVAYEAPGTRGTPNPSALTASFENAPASHDGSSTITVELAFSEAVFDGTESFDRNQRIGDAVAVTNGVVKGQQRVDPQKYDRWRLWIEPSSNGDVALRLPVSTCDAANAICTPGGTALSEEATATIGGPGLPELSIADAEVEEAPRARLVFTITLSKATDESVSFDVTSSDGSAIAGEDYHAKDISRTMAAGTTQRVIKIKVLDDDIDEGDETMMVTISNVQGATLADATATGTIKNSDPLPKAWMIRFGRTVGSQVVDAVGARLKGAGANHVTIGGVNLMGGNVEDEDERDALGLPEWETERTLEPAAQTMTPGEILLRSSFALSAGEARPGSTRLGAWGHFATSTFEGTEDGVDHEGDVVTGMLGADIARERALAGIVLSHSVGDGGYTGTGAGDIKSTMTGVYPYGRIDLNERVSAWALAGAGSGSITVSPEGATRIETDASMRLGAIGLHGRVLEANEEGGLTLNVRTDAMWVGAETERTAGMVGTKADASRLRLIVEAQRGYDLGGATITPTGEIGVRHDAGDAETGTGIELGAGLRYSSGRFAAEGRVRGLVAHEDDGYREWGASGSIRLEPGAGGQGLNLSVAPVWGDAASGAERLWSARDARDLDPERAFEADGRLEAEMGYGLHAPHGRGLVTPYAALTLAGERRTMRAGARWDIADGAALGVEGTHSGDDDRALNLRLRVSF